MQSKCASPDSTGIIRQAFIEEGHNKGHCAAVLILLGRILKRSVPLFIPSGIFLVDALQASNCFLSSTDFDLYGQLRCVPIQTFTDDL